MTTTTNETGTITDNLRLMDLTAEFYRNCSGFQIAAIKSIREATRTFRGEPVKLLAAKNLLDAARIFYAEWIDGDRRRINSQPPMWAAWVSEFAEFDRDGMDEITLEQTIARSLPDLTQIEVRNVRRVARIIADPNRTVNW